MGIDEPRRENCPLYNFLFLLFDSHFIKALFFILERLSNSLRTTTLFFKKRLYKNLYEIGDRIINRRKNQKSKEVNKDTKEII